MNPCWKTPEERRLNILGIGRGLPKQTVTNQQLEQILDTCDVWIQSRAGNTSSASIPLLMRELCHSGRLQKGKPLALSPLARGW